MEEQQSFSGKKNESVQMFGKQEFCPEEREAIRQLLHQKLGKEHLATRPGAGGTSFTYVESWKVIELANQIFGFNGWSSSVVDITPDYVRSLTPRTKLTILRSRNAIKVDLPLE
jgi:DNA recombination protein Rad52